jgi:hypothetical protein
LEKERNNIGVVVVAVGTVFSPNATPNTVLFVSFSLSFFFGL